MAKACDIGMIPGIELQNQMIDERQIAITQTLRITGTDLYVSVQSYWDNIGKKVRVTSGTIDGRLVQDDDAIEYLKGLEGLGGLLG